MSFDFPTSPAENQTYTPSGGPTYIFKSPRWMVQGIPGGVSEAPNDGKPYARKSLAWDDLTDDFAAKAATVHTHAESDVTNLVSDLALKAPLASPTFTGDPKAPTPSAGDSDTSIATTAFVTGGIATSAALKEDKANKGAANGYAPLDATSKVPAINLPAYVDDVIEVANFAALPGTGTTGIIYVTLDTNKVYRWSGSAYVEISPSPGSSDAVPEGSVNLYYTAARSALKADLASPTFTGDPKAPTPTAGDADTSIATTAFVGTAVSTAITAAAVPPPATVAPLMDGAAVVGTTTKYAREDHKHPSDTAKLDVTTASTTYAPIASPTLTGDPKAPTATTGDNDTSIATTAFVQTAVQVAKVAISDTAPGSPADASLWWESDTGLLFIRYNDGNTTQWVQIAASTA